MSTHLILETFPTKEHWMNSVSKGQSRRDMDLYHCSRYHFETQRSLHIQYSVLLNYAQDIVNFSI